MRGKTQVAAAGDFAIVSRDAPPDVVPSLEDHRAMPGYRWGEQRSRSTIVRGFDVSRALLPMQGKARLRLRAGTTANSADAMALARIWVTVAEIGSTWSLPLASLFVGVGANSRGTQRFDVSIGPQF